MSTRLHFALVIAVVVYFVLLGNLLRKNRVLLKYALLWILAGICMLILAAFPEVLYWFAGLVGIFSPVNALFTITLFFVIIILVSITAIVSALNEKVKRLVQNQALLEERISKLENRDVHE